MNTDSRILVALLFKMLSYRNYNNHTWNYKNVMI